MFATPPRRPRPPSYKQRLRDAANERRPLPTLAPMPPPPEHAARLSPPKPWRRLSDAEFATLRTYLHAADRPRRGRPIHALRLRLDACLWMARHDRLPWHALPPIFGKAETVARCFRRWAQTGLWAALLRALRDPDHAPALEPREHVLCLAWRRCRRLFGREVIRLARALGLHTALPGPTWLLPDPDLSDWALRQAVTVTKPLQDGGLIAGERFTPREKALLDLLMRIGQGSARPVPRCLWPA